MTRKPQVPNEQQRLFNANLPGANKHALRRARQITSQQRYPYDGHLAPVCLRCGGLRENRRILLCDSCSN